MSVQLIYHFTTLSEWEHAQDKGMYEPLSYATEGFIHCATDDQLDRVLQKHFQHHENLVKLVIDPTRLTQQLKYDAVAGEQGEYPHIYGPLNLEAVTQIIFLDPISSED